MATPDARIDLPTEARGCGCWLWLAALVAVGAVAGSLFLTLGMNLIACPLCLYQRVFVLGTAGVLVMGLLLGGSRHSLVALLALPGAVGGLATGVFQEYLVWNGTIECPKGILGIGSATQQAIAIQAVLVVVLFVAVFAGHKVGPEALAALGAIVLGAGLAAGAVFSAPPLVRPATAYPKHVDEHGCRPVYLPAP